MQPKLVVNPPRFLVIDGPAFTLKRHMDTPVAVTHPRLANLLDALSKDSLIGAAGFVAIAFRIKPERRTRPADRDLPIATQPVSQLALPNRL